MPKTTKSGSAKKSELPGTLKRSPAKAQRTYAKAHDSAADVMASTKSSPHPTFSVSMKTFSLPKCAARPWRAGPSRSRRRAATTS